MGVRVPPTAPLFHPEFSLALNALKKKYISVVRSPPFPQHSWRLEKAYLSTGGGGERDRFPVDSMGLGLREGGFWKVYEGKLWYLVQVCIYFRERFPGAGLFHLRLDCAEAGISYGIHGATRLFPHSTFQIIELPARGPRWFFLQLCPAR